MEIQYKVVVNHEQQYSLWLHSKTNAPGWSDAGFAGHKDACLAYVREVWTDMRPLSLRRRESSDRQWAQGPVGCLAA